MLPRLVARPPVGQGACSGGGSARSAYHGFAARFAAERQKTVGQRITTERTRLSRLKSQATLWTTAEQAITRSVPSSKRLLGQLPGRGWVRLPCTSAIRNRTQKISTGVRIS